MGFSPLGVAAQLEASVLEPHRELIEPYARRRLTLTGAACACALVDAVAI
jgi:hypothetical protein